MEARLTKPVSKGGPSAAAGRMPVGLKAAWVRATRGSCSPWARVIRRTRRRTSRWDGPARLVGTLCSVAWAPRVLSGEGREIWREVQGQVQTRRKCTRPSTGTMRWRRGAPAWDGDVRLALRTLQILAQQLERGEVVGLGSIGRTFMRVRECTKAAHGPRAKPVWV